MVVYESGALKAFDNINLFYQKNIVDNPISNIIILHGACEHSGRYEDITNKLNEYGHNVYRIDIRGHGQSEGKKGFLDRFEYIVDDLDLIVDKAKKETIDIKTYILGHSFGGLIAMIYGIKNKEKIDGVIISSATTFDKAGALKIFQKDLGADDFIQNNLGDLLCSDKYVNENYKNDILVLKKITVGFVQQMIEGIEWMKKHINDFKYPVLIMHGTSDQIVSYLDSVSLFNMLPKIDKEIEIYEELWHEILNEYKKDIVIDRINDWVLSKSNT